MNHACPEDVVYVVALKYGQTMDGLAWIMYADA